MRAQLFGTQSSVSAHQGPYVFLSIFSYNARMVMAGLLLFVLVGSGTASAAQGALPGDLLYAVKISINERVEAAAAPTTVAKAEVQVRLAERRVEEAQSLAAQGRLDAATAEKLAVSFDAHAESAQKLADEVEVSEPGTSSQIKTKLASSFAVNGAVLKNIGKGSSDKNTQEQSDSFGTRVIARAEGSARVALNARIFAAASSVEAPAPKIKTSGSETVAISMNAPEDATAQADISSEKMAARLQNKSAEALAGAKKLFEDTKSTMDATTTLQLQKELAAADTHMSVGSTALGEGKFEQAQADFTEVLRISTRLSALLWAQKKFDGGIIRSLIHDEEESGAEAELQIGR